MIARTSIGYSRGSYKIKMVVRGWFGVQVATVREPIHCRNTASIIQYWRADRVAEGTPLLREHVGKNLHRGFESLALRQFNFNQGNNMLLVPGKNFKMSKQTKRNLTQFIDAHERGAYKRAMIQAQLASEQVIKSKKDRK
jgi:hypothetical protein